MPRGSGFKGLWGVPWLFGGVLGVGWCGVGVCGVLVDDVDCVLCVVVGVEYGSGEDLGGFGEVV